MMLHSVFHFYKLVLVTYCKLNYMLCLIVTKDLRCESCDTLFKVFSYNLVSFLLLHILNVFS